MRLVLYFVYGLIALAAANFLYQVIRKPSELLFPVSGVLYKTPAETWRAYGPLFRRYATGHVSAPLLAALAQVEGSGNPLVRTYWRWSWQPFDFYRPASSAVGMYQMTDATFLAARHYCIHQHRLLREGPWDDWRGCWFNRLYLRILPRDAVELTAADLELKISGILATLPRTPSPAQLQHLAATVHLCGAGAAQAYAHRGFRPSPAQRCGEHDPRLYQERVDAFAREFTQLAAAQEAGSAAQ
jgi:hypothetical protein